MILLSSAKDLPRICQELAGHRLHPPTFLRYASPLVPSQSQIAWPQNEGAAVPWPLAAFNKNNKANKNNTKTTQKNKKSKVFCIDHSQRLIFMSWSRSEMQYKSGSLSAWLILSQLYATMMATLSFQYSLTVLMSMSKFSNNSKRWSIKRKRISMEML